jgi:hypothetical protein
MLNKSAKGLDEAGDVERLARRTKAVNQKRK